MIHSKTPVTMSEVKEIVDKLDEKEELKTYLKAFTKLSKKESEKLKEEIQNMKNMKIKDEHVVKVADFMPANQEEVRKIFIDTSLTDEETNAIVEIVKKY